MIFRIPIVSVARVYRDEDAVGSPTIGLAAGMSSIIQGRNLIANCVEENNTFIGAWERGCWLRNVFDR